MYLIHLYETTDKFKTDYFGDGYKEPWVSYTIENEKTKYNKTMYETYLTFEITGNGTIKWYTTNNTFTTTIEYKKNDNEWRSITSSLNDAPTINVENGDIVQFRGNNAAYASGSSVYNLEYNWFSIDLNGTTRKINIKGNIMSLIDGDDFPNKTVLESGFTFYCLFNNCPYLNDASKLVLPATALTPNCYGKMFDGCRGLIKAPATLPAAILTESCYANMFNGCISLTTTPELPATTLAKN